MRFCRADGTLEFKHKMGQNTAPTDFKAWFLHENRLLADTDIFRFDRQG
jgi:bis(5'-nucleosyl)-tetraphosphatase (symmetrical)